MSAGAIHSHFEQPTSFAFNDESMVKVNELIAKYPKGRQASAVMGMLWVAQQQHDNWIPEKAMEEIARILDMPKIKVYEVATFYTMYNLAPRGTHHLQFCTTTPCWLRGSSDVVHACEKHLGIKLGETTPDGQFTITDVECLGACVNAPVVQYNGDEFYEDLTADNIVTVIETLKRGQKPKAGSQIGRHASTSEVGATSLFEQADKAGIKKAGK